MKTYFIAGYTVLPETEKRTDFWRVVNIDDKISAHELIDSVIEEVTENEINLYWSERRADWVRGKATITGFNLL
jgi:hypothetical protein